MTITLQALYNGELHPAEDIETSAARRLFGEQEQAFLQGLSTEQGQRFHQLLDNWAQLSAQETEQAFQEGFRLGGKLMMEMLCDKNRH